MDKSYLDSIAEVLFKTPLIVPKHGETIHQVMKTVSPVDHTPSTTDASML